MSRFFRRQMIMAAGVLLTGCANIDFDYPRISSTARVETDASYLSSWASRAAESKPLATSGFLPLQDGIDALSARLLLADKAEHTIDAQYYLIKDDVAGLAFIGALLRAADRGVRVRLLVDDMFTKGYDAGMAGLDSHPNFEIRIFNPFYRSSAGKLWSGLTDFRRVNRRMHTKTFTVDNQLTILGGRNIAGEYFGASEDAKFKDLDVIGVGPVVRDVSAMFDSFWNHETALPVPAFSRTRDDPAESLRSLRTRLAAARVDIADTQYAEAVMVTALSLIDIDEKRFSWSPYKLVYDSPDKGIKTVATPAATIVPSIVDALRAAQTELIVVSPYFVPRKSGVEFFAEIQAQGVRVTIVTNSLAANNQLAVHGGYAPSRKPLLESGIRIYEVRPDADVKGSEFVAASGAKATLHTKAFLVDRRTTFVGSFNFDPRSVNLNTESGVIIQSDRIAEELGKAFDDGIRSQTYELFLNDRGQLRWRSFEDGEEVIYKKDPKSTWSQRLLAGIIRLLPVKSQL